jgi:hypothetical protein
MKTDNFARWKARWQEGDYVTHVTRSGQVIVGRLKWSFRNKAGQRFLMVKRCDGVRANEESFVSAIWTFGRGAHKLTCLDVGCGQVFYTDDHTQDFCPCCVRTMRPDNAGQVSQAVVRNTLRGPLTRQGQAS